jgi:hypothetical protein
LNLIYSYPEVAAEAAGVFLAAKRFRDKYPRSSKLYTLIYIDILAFSCHGGEADTTKDLPTFLDRQLEVIGKMRDHFSDWSKVFEKPVERTSKFFIYATTVCLYIRDDSWSPRDELYTLLTGDGVDPNSQADELDKIYIQILHKLIRGVSHDRDKPRLLKRLRQVAGCIVVL